MAGFKAPDFNERTAAARAAKQKELDRLREKPALDPAVLAERKAAQERREAAAAEKRAARQRALEEAKAEKAARDAAKAEEKAAAAAEQAKPAKSEAELKAARDARYAARKARKR